MSAIIPIDIERIEDAVEEPSRTYRLDLESGRIAGMVDELEAVNQFIHKALNTPRYRLLIYDNQYGSEIKELIIAGDATQEYIETELPRMIKDSLLVDSRILDIYEFACLFSDERAFISFSVSTIFGETRIKDVI